MKPDLRTELARKVSIVADGGMGTSLYDAGFYINRSFEELSLTHPHVVRDVSRAFRNAGAQIISTNSFGANRPKFTQHGLQSQLETILRSAAKIALEEAGDSAWASASIGPLGLVLEPLGPTSLEDAERYFREVAGIFEDSGIDIFHLETFHDLNEIEAAIRAIRSVTNRPLIASVAIKENLKTSFGHSLKEIVARLEQSTVDVIGLNCEIGPGAMLEAVLELRTLTKKPISAMPNAGLPKYTNDRWIYMCNPDYMGKYAKRFRQAGADIIGGCCGTTHAHIQAISNSLRMTRGTDRSETLFRIHEQTNGAGQRVFPSRLAEKSRLGKYLDDGEKVFSVELTPPRGAQIKEFLKDCQELKNSGLEFVNIPDGARAMARMGSLHAAVCVQRSVGLDPIPHFTARDRNLLALQADLIGAHANGIRNILLVTGDPPKLGNCPDATAVYDVDSIGLTHIVSRMNRGLDLGGSPLGEATKYVICVALNPTAVNVDLEVERFFFKVEAGAEVAITQPIYDLGVYADFMNRIQKNSAASKVPVIMGIWPLVSLRNAEFLKYEVPGVSVPDWVLAEMGKSGGTGEEATKRGLEIASKTIEEAFPQVQGFQISAPFNRVKLALNLIDQIRGSSAKVLRGSQQCLET